MSGTNSGSKNETEPIHRASIIIKQFGRFFLNFIIAGIIFFSMPMIVPVDAATDCTDEETVTANIVALDQPIFYNRLGVVNPTGMVYALRRDVVNKTTGLQEAHGASLTAGNVMLRPDKRPRPITLRVNEGECLQIKFQNLLNPIAQGDQPATRNASIHVMGMQLVNSIASDGSWVGANPSSLAAPGESKTYTFYAEHENTYLLYSPSSTTGGEGNGGSQGHGLFGAVNVEPPGAEYYRSQLTAADLALATTSYTADGHPIINYDAVYPAGHKFAGDPILNMKKGNEIVHTDLNAIITGPGKGNFNNIYNPNPVDVPLSEDGPGGTTVGRTRNEPFREFTVVYHDEINATQAFPEFTDPVLKFVLAPVKDGFAINYGTGGIGAEILANRKGLGPMKDCVECKYEEFFLTSWVLGDPAMIVDIPANLGTATVAYYPDDPSNVHHSYLGDHVKFRNLHAGKEHHVFHLHSHQWLFAPNSDNSSYLDSQMIGPGSGYTYEIAYNGGGNRNQAVGDSIFHCHFYPHFAQGMWELWRNHDVFENGTALAPDGKPFPGSRALPDAQIKSGTPIPALVPLPGRPMAPMPGVQVSIDPATGQALCGNEPCNNASTDDLPANMNPGYPFFIPASAGHRPPGPVLDTIDDGGLPRHMITGGIAISNETRLDFDKNLISANAIEVPENGTKYEKAAMNFHAIRFHPTYDTSGAAAAFKTNGLPPAPGAPYADPCVDDFGNAVGKPRNYSAAHIQLDLIMNKMGWHYPQERMISLWGDVVPFLTGAKPPEPLFFRANTNDCITFNHTNLVPHVLEQDDYQVKTPTDIIGQHIHLVKFDVTSSDGSANGWNYEDGTFSPDEVRERIKAINAGIWVPVNGVPVTLAPRAHPFFGATGPNGENWLGAQTKVQRWYADNVLNMAGKDRTLRTVFTHDHYGPSSHQQTGVYAGLLIEPENSTWRDPETGAFYGSRTATGPTGLQITDGGPTSWRADILTQNPADSYREFMFEFADFQHAYKAGGGVDASGFPIPDPANVINPTGKAEAGLPDLLIPPIQAGTCPTTDGSIVDPAHGCPQAISGDDPGTMLVNYRNEPVALRVLDPPNTQATGDSGDLSKVYLSNINRAIGALNTQPAFYPPLTSGIKPGDPYTPLLRVYENDKVQVRTLVGAHEEGHNFNIHGIKWLQEPSDPNSGNRNSQGMGISEHFEFVVPSMGSVKGALPFEDYMYQAGSSIDDEWNGIWGIMRTYSGPDATLLTLPSNPTGKAPRVRNSRDFKGVCPVTAPSRKFSISAVTAAQALPGGRLEYNSRTFNGGPLNDPTAILYVYDSDLDGTGKLKPGVMVEPLILRANAGDCIDVTLTNRLPAALPPVTNPDQWGFSTLPMIVTDNILDKNFNMNHLMPSNNVGLHPQMVAYDMGKNGDGSNVGFNPIQTAAPGEIVKYRWYTGNFNLLPDGTLTARPVEFGATNLISSDPIKHSNKGAIGALIVEPLGSTWTEDKAFLECGQPGKPRCSRAGAVVIKPDGTSFREFVLLFQDDVNQRFGSSATLPSFNDAGDPVTLTFSPGQAVPNIANEEDAEDSGQKAVNYRTEPMWFRMGYAPNAPLGFTHTVDYTMATANALVGEDPETPVFKAHNNTPVIFRILEPNGHSRNTVFTLHGHVWEREPYIQDSTKIGLNPLSEWFGSVEGHGPSDHFDIVTSSNAGGRFNITGDYLYRNMGSLGFDGGQWGILNVTECICGVDLSVDAPARTTGNMINATYVITVFNPGDEEETYDLAMQAPPDARAALNMQNITVDSKMSGTVLLNVTSPKPGVYAVNVTASYPENPPGTETITMTTTVLPRGLV